MLLFLWELIITIDSTLIDQALKVWNADREIYKPEIARTTFLKSRLHRSLGQEDRAALLWKESAKLRAEIVGLGTDVREELQKSDFDKLVTFWSR